MWFKRFKNGAGLGRSAFGMFSASITLDRACENARDTAVSVVARGLGKKMSSKDDHAQYEVWWGYCPH